MKKKSLFITGIAAACGAFILSSCKGDLSPGVEYMPDMYRSPAIEAYQNYNNTDSMTARMPAPGSIPFGGIEAMSNVNLPYAGTNTPESYEASSRLTNPVPLSTATLAQGKDLYTKFCVHCHGPEGNGDGSMVTNDKFPAPPSYKDKLKDLPEGKMFHTITYGKGLMGSHASQLSQEERWKVIHYVKQLQGGAVTPAADTSSVTTPAVPNPGADKASENAAKEYNKTTR